MLSSWFTLLKELTSFIGNLHSQQDNWHTWSMIYTIYKTTVTLDQYFALSTRQVAPLLGDLYHLQDIRHPWSDIYSLQHIWQPLTVIYTVFKTSGNLDQWFTVFKRKLASLICNLDWLQDNWHPWLVTIKALNQYC